MSVSRQSRCLFAATLKPPHPTSVHSPLTRQLHTSSPRQSNRTPKYPSVKASSLGLTPQLSASDFPTYTPSEQNALSKKYSPAQLAAIQAGEAAISPDDLATQATLRNDPMSLRYLDDFASIRPVIDKPILAPETNHDPNLRFKTEDELANDLYNWVTNMPEDPDRVEWMKFVDNNRLMVGKPEAELNPRMYLAPDIPKLDVPGMRFSSPGDSEPGEENDPHIRRLIRQTGYSVQQIRRFRVKHLVEHRVVNQTRLGKIQSTYYLAVAGNGKGLLGIGEGKSTEVEDARRQAQLAAIRNMVPIPRYEERTIYGDVTGKVGATELILMTRTPGFGLRCQHHIYEICKCAGISDLAARVTRSRNPMNTVKATVEALLSQRIPEQVARARGRKLVDVRKVYYGGSV